MGLNQSRFSWLLLGTKFSCLFLYNSCCNLLIKYCKIAVTHIRSHLIIAAKRTMVSLCCLPNYTYSQICGCILRRLP